MKILGWVVRGIVAVFVVVLLLDSFGGMLFEGPLGPIPGGAFAGPVSSESDPGWDELEEVIELEIRPEKPWSLSVWNVVIDGELYIPSKFGAKRRWPAVALKDPRVRVRTRGEIYERQIVLVTDPQMRRVVGQAISDRYGSGAAPPEDDDIWYFHLAPRS